MKTVLTALITESAGFKAIVSALVFVCAYVLPTQEAVNAAVACAVLIGLDTFTGLMAAAITKTVITSRKLSRFFVKLTGYSCALLAIAVATRQIPGLAEAAHDASITAVLTFIILTELLSVMENLIRMRVLSPLLRRIMPFIKDQLEGYAKTVDQEMKSQDRRSDSGQE